MPAIRHYIVRETKMVEVTANTPADAVRIAEAAFKYGQTKDNGVASQLAPEGVWGDTTTHIRTIETIATEKS